MTDIERYELALYRMTKAKETLADVELLMQNNRLNNTVNRLYYACFYAATALLIRNNIYSKTHSGTKQMLGLHFVTTGLIETKLAVFYSELFDTRQQGDYEDFFYFDKDDVTPLIAPAIEFVDRMETLLNMSKQ